MSITEDDALKPDDSSKDWKNDLPGEPTLASLNKRIDLRRAHEKYESHMEFVRRHPKKEYDPDTIAKNLRALMKSQQLSIREAVAAISPGGKYEPKEYRWLKRVANEGIVHTDKRSLVRLEKLAALFGVTVAQLRTDDLDRMLVYEEFNRVDSPGFRRYACMLDELLSDERYGFIEFALLALHLGTEDDGAARAQEAERLAEAFMAEKRGDNKRNQRCIRLLSRLLRTGTHEYLKNLITDLYSLATRQWAADYKEEFTDLAGESD